jgi:antitoxin VapB
MSQTLSVGSIFLNNRTQAVRLPSQTRFPAHIKQVSVRICGLERVLTPIGQEWDSFFLSDHSVADDFCRGEQIETAREAFE